uniref:Uncharacterized protein n=1 Tax=Oncorhynchus tshawytscha TaxID=74940 RepID=A0A8C8J5T6_ONCTS
MHWLKNGNIIPNLTEKSRSTDVIVHLKSMFARHGIFSGRNLQAFATDYGFEHVMSSPRFPYLGLLAYRSTPLRNGYSPTELQMGRRLYTTLLTFPAVLKPVLPDIRKMDTKCYDKRHQVRDLSRLSPGGNMWITDTKAQGTVTSAHRNPRSYLVSRLQGTHRRNRHHLVPMTATKNNCEDSQQLHVPEDDMSTSVNCQVIPANVRTRSGRKVIKPKNLDL